MKKAGLILLFVAFIFLQSCRERPSNVLPRKEMTDLLFDLQLANAMSDNYYIEFGKTEEGKLAIMNSVLNKHKLTRADLDSSLAWYSDNLAEYKIINESIASRFRRELDVLRTENEAISGSETSNKGALPFNFYLDGSSPSKTFLFEEIDMRERGGFENFSLSFKTLGLNETNRIIETGIYFVYKDTTVIRRMTLNKDSLYTILKPELSDSLLTQIQGYFRLPRVRTHIPLRLYDVKYTIEDIGEEIGGLKLKPSSSF